MSLPYSSVLLWSCLILRYLPENLPEGKDKQYMSEFQPMDPKGLRLKAYLDIHLDRWDHWMILAVQDTDP